MAGNPARLTPSQKVALKPWLDDARLQISSILDAWRSGDEAGRQAIAQIEKYLAADRRRQKAMAKEANEGWRRKQEESEDGQRCVSSLKESLSALHYLLQESGLSLQAATIGKALSEWTSTNPPVPRPTLQKSLEDALAVVEAPDRRMRRRCPD